MRLQAIAYGTDYKKSQVFMVEINKDGTKSVYTPDATYKAKALVLATGAMGRKPTINSKGKLTFWAEV